MNERFEKWARDYFGLPVAQSWQMILNGGAGSRVVREITIAHLAWQAALSAASPNNGTYCIHGIKCALCAEGVSPAGTAAPPECGVCGAKPGEKGHGADAMGNVHHVPSAPPREGEGA